MGDSKRTRRPQKYSIYSEANVSLNILFTLGAGSNDESSHLYHFTINIASTRGYIRYTKT